MQNQAEAFQRGVREASKLCFLKSCRLKEDKMKIAELRALLDQTAPEEMKRLVVELYRALPKKTRETLAIDEFLKNPGAARPGAKPPKALRHRVDMDDVAAEIEQFLGDAYAQNYFAPNRFVHKSERNRNGASKSSASSMRLMRRSSNPGTSKGRAICWKSCTRCFVTLTSICSAAKIRFNSPDLQRSSLALCWV